jgi:uncharacterized protein
MDAGARVDVALVAGGRWHDIDFARLRLLEELDRHDVARTSVHDDYSDVAALREADVLVTYTSDVRPTAAQTQVLSDWLSAGGRWLALHATCSAVDPPGPGADRVFATPRVIDGLVALLGGQFLAHPPIGSYRVEVTDPTHPLVAALEPFDTVDELYVCEMHEPVDVLLHTVFDGECRGFAEGGRPADEFRPVLWQKQTGAGTVTTLTLGHCRGRWDVRDLGVADLGVQDRVAWESPGYREVLSRSLAWALHGDDWTSCTNRSQGYCPDPRSSS